MLLNLRQGERQNQTEIARDGKLPMTKFVHDLDEEIFDVNEEEKRQKRDKLINVLSVETYNSIKTIKEDPSDESNRDDLVSHDISARSL